MDSKKMTILDKINNCILQNQNFVLQGGAGSGKTETLKQVIENVSKNYPDKKVVCITHTNLAVDEIISRVGNEYTISTIHSFLNSFIKNFKKNIHQVIFEIFKIEPVQRKNISQYADEKEQKLEEHKNYKKIYEKFASKLYTVKGETIGKVTGKREYDASPEEFNSDLNSKIDILNDLILEEIKKTDYSNIRYNDTRFDNFKELTFGHDSLIKIAFILFERFPLLSKIVQDKYDFILIDEYQDTHEDIIKILLEILPKESKTVVGLFGDSMQGIYEDGIGDVQDYVREGTLTKIEKEDNYRCSEQVIDFINELRDDGLRQELALKLNTGGIPETKEERQGMVKLYYSLYNEDKPHARSSREDKGKYLETLKFLINEVEEKHSGYKKLMLTNKSISQEVGFENLYTVFDDRYNDVKDEIEKCLIRIQLLDLVELSLAFNKKDYNFVLSKIKKSGFQLNNAKDKKRVSLILNSINDPNKSAMEILELAFDNKLLRKTDSYLSYVSRKNSFLEELSEDIFYTRFKNLYENGKNTFNRMLSEVPDLKSEKFNDYERLYKREQFFLALFSDRIKFDEVYKYFDYLNENTEYITMHKTKGSGIDNTIIILDEYFWSKYDFKTIFNPEEENQVKKLKNQKLFYVACSRTISNLVCIKLIKEEEREDILKFFPINEEIVLP